MKINLHTNGKHYTTLTVDGKKKFIYGESPDEVEKKYTELKYKHNIGYNISSDPTIGEYAEQWFKVFKADTGSMSTRRMYKNCVDHHIVKKIGNKKLKELTGTQAQSFIKDITSSKSLANKVRITLDQIYKQAIEDRLVAFNPVSNCKVMAPEDPKRECLSDIQRELLLKILDGHKFYPICFTLLYTGMRMGEAIALKRKRDIDFEKKVIQVEEATEFKESQPIPKDPKTKRGFREIPMAPELYTFLQKHLVGNKTLYVFPGHHGGQMGLTEITRLIKKANEKVKRFFDDEKNKKYKAHRFHITFRLLRHTFCTALYDAGIDELSAAAIMGHNVEVMRKIYTHIQKSRKEKTAVRIGSIYKSRKKGNRAAR